LAPLRFYLNSHRFDMQVQKDQDQPPTSGMGGGGGGGGDGVGGGGGGGGNYPPHTVLEMPALSPTMSQGEHHAPLGCRGTTLRLYAVPECPTNASMLRHKAYAEATAI